MKSLAQLCIEFPAYTPGNFFNSSKHNKQSDVKQCLIKSFEELTK